MIKTQTSWEELKDSLPIGMKVRGKVLRHAPFGVFVSLPGIPFDGLVQITDFKDKGRMTPSEYQPLNRRSTPLCWASKKQETKSGSA